MTDNSNYEIPLRPIAEFVMRPDFPQCALGAHVDIGGSTGVVVEIVKQSLKVRSQEGTTQSFNSAWLRKIYGPAPVPEPAEMTRSADSSADPATQVAEDAPPPRKRELIETPDFSQELKAIRVYASRPDFPRCAYGKYVDIRGYAGVVVEIVDRSLKIRSNAEVTRSFNADVLRKLYGQP